MPYIYTDTGERLHRGQIVGNIQKGCTLEKKDDKYIVNGFASEECAV